MKRLFTAIALVALGACSPLPVVQNRVGDQNAQRYAQLRPYYTNHMYFSPHIYLRAVMFPQDEGAGQFRPDIEIFYARPVEDPPLRLNLALAAIALTCPQTDLSGATNRIVHDDPEYVLVQNLACQGYAP